MTKIITTLHPANDEDTNLYPNILKENIPDASIDTSKLDKNVLDLIGSLKPSGVDTSTNILAFTNDKGIYVASDNGNWYYWNGTSYVLGGIFIADSEYDKIKSYFDIMYNNVIGNLVYGLSFTQGYIDGNETIQPSQTYYYQLCTEDYISVEANKSYSLEYFTILSNVGINSYCLIRKYDSNYNPIGNVGGTISNYTTINGYRYIRIDFDTPSNCAYIRFSFFSLSSSFTDYQVYLHLKIINVLGELENKIDKLEFLSSLQAYGSRLVEPSGSNIIEFTKNDTDIIVKLPTRLFYFVNSSSSEPLTVIDISTLSYTVPNYYIFAYDIINNNFDVIYPNTFINDMNRYVLLFRNNNGYPIGQWRKYWLYGKNKNYIDEIKINPNHNSNYNLILREGDIDGVPLNSIYGVIQTKKFCYDGIRVSVRITSDDVFVLCHDDTINSVARNSDGSIIPEDIYVANNTYQTLNSYDYGIKYGSQYAGLGLTTLDDFLKKASQIGIEITIELKVALSNAQLYNLCLLISKYGLGTNIWISDDHTSNLDYITSHLPFVNIAYIHTLNTAGIDICETYVNNKHKTRMDMYRSDTITNNLVYYANSKGIDLKVGSAYNSTELINFATNGIKYIECAYVKYPKEILYNNVNI